MIKKMNFVFGRLGFTLIELIVALSVVSIGITILVQLFIISLNVNQNSHNSALASCIAKERLEYIIAFPEKFYWKIPTALKPGEIFQILTSVDEPKTGNRVDPPKAVPPDWASFRKYKVASDKFYWKAYGKMSEANSEVYEITVVVSYKEGGRERNVTLTSFVPVYRVNKNVRSISG